MILKKWGVDRNHLAYDKVIEISNGLLWIW